MCYKASVWQTAVQLQLRSQFKADVSATAIVKSVSSAKLYYWMVTDSHMPNTLSSLTKPVAELYV